MAAEANTNSSAVEHILTVHKALASISGMKSKRNFALVLSYAVSTRHLSLTIWEVIC